jgi:hypothetical protein
MLSSRQSQLLLALAWLTSTVAALSAFTLTAPVSSDVRINYLLARTLGPGIEWRFNPLVVDLDGDGHLDLVATARLAEHSLYMWRGDGKGDFIPIERTWTDIGYAALATGDINGDGIPDIVAASHFGGVQTLLGDGKGRFTEKIIRRKDGYTGVQLADVNQDGHPDLILIGYKKAGIEVYFGDGAGNWAPHTTLPEIPPGPTLPGRAVAVADLNHDGHQDIVAAFQRWGVYVYYGDGHGGFTGGAVDFPSSDREFPSLALGDVNGDGNLDIVLNGTHSVGDELNGPDVYLGDGHGGWRPSTAGLKVLRFASAGIALGDLNRDGNLDIVATGAPTAGPRRAGSGLFWFRGDGKGGWSLVRDCGLPTDGSLVPHSVVLADLDESGSPQIIALNGGPAGSITISKRQ